MIERILLPLDGSERAEHAIPLAIRLATIYGSEVVILRVVEGPRLPTATWSDPVAWRLERGEALLYLAAVKKRFVEAGVSVDLDVTMGDPAQEILECALVRDADLVILTNPGPDDMRDPTLSGTTQRVVAAVDASLLVLPTVEGAEPFDRMQRILVPLDGSRRSEWALRVGINLAAAARASVTALYVVQEPDVIEGAASEELRGHAAAYVDAGREVAARYLSSAVANLDVPDVPATIRVESGPNVCRAITRVAAEEEASLILASAHGRTGAGECRFGAVTQGLLHRVERPLLVLQDSTRPTRPRVRSVEETRPRRARSSAPAR